MMIQALATGMTSLKQSEEAFGKKRVRRHDHSEIPRGRPLFPKSTRRRSGQAQNDTPRPLPQKERARQAWLEVMV